MDKMHRLFTFKISKKVVSDDKGDINLVNDPAFDDTNYIKKGKQKAMFTKEAKIDDYPYIKAILDIEPQYRKADKIMGTIPFLKNYEDIYELLTMYEDDPSMKEMLIQEFLKISSLQTIFGGRILKNFKKNNHLFYTILSGSVVALNVEYLNMYLSNEEYLIFLRRLEIYHEKELLRATILMNKTMFDLTNITSVQEFIENNKLLYDYKRIQSKAKEKMSKIERSLKEGGIIVSLGCHITNTSFEQPIKSSEEKAKNSKKFLIPRLKITRVYYKGSYIGDFPMEKDINDDTIFIVLQESEILVTDKNRFKNERFFKLINEKIRRIILQYSPELYMFSFTPVETVIQKYSKYFSIKTFKYNEPLFIENEKYKGVFILLDGIVEMTTSKSYEEIGNILENMKDSLYAFLEDYSSLVDLKIKNEDNKFRTISDIFGTKQFADATKENKHISILKIERREVIGLNETYDIKNNFYNFNCYSRNEHTKVLTISREAFDIILKREPVIRRNIIKIIENRFFIVKTIIQTFKKNFKENFLFKNSASFKLQNLMLYQEPKRPTFGKKPIQTFEDNNLCRTLTGFNVKKKWNSLLLNDPAINAMTKIKTCYSDFPKIIDFKTKLKTTNNPFRATHTTFSLSTTTRNYHNKTSPNFYAKNIRSFS